MQDIVILGGAQTDFARHWAREGRDLFAMFEDVVHAALEDAGMTARDIEVGHVGTFTAELFAHQGLTGGFFPHVDPGFDGMPSARHEAACASGSAAVLAAMADLEAGRFATALVVGLELMRNVPGKAATDHIGCAAWAGREAVGAPFVWPRIFSELAEEVDRRHGLDWRHLAEISRIAFENARRNPQAHTRDWDMSGSRLAPDDAANPVIDGWLRRSDCAQLSDGAAAIVLAAPKRARDIARRQGRDPERLARIRGWGWRTAPLLFEAKLAASRGQDVILPHMAGAIADAFQRAGVPGVECVDVIETHDCFSITHYLAIEAFGITPPGQAWQAIEAGRTAAGGDIPMNVGGGLIGGGHPVGATGVRMLLDAARQVEGRAGPLQVEGARTAATFNLGGSGTMNCAFVVGAGPA